MIISVSAGVPRVADGLSLRSGVPRLKPDAEESAVNCPNRADDSCPTGLAPEAAMVSYMCVCSTPLCPRGGAIRGEDQAGPKHAE
jgi:hypothetical protein